MTIQDEINFHRQKQKDDCHESIEILFYFNILTPSQRRIAMERLYKSFGLPLIEKKYDFSVTIYMSPGLYTENIDLSNGIFLSGEGK
jgi:hypothetical protein